MIISDMETNRCFVCSHLHLLYLFPNESGAPLWLVNASYGLPEADLVMYECIWQQWIRIDESRHKLAAVDSVVFRGLIIDVGKAFDLPDVGRVKTSGTSSYSFYFRFADYLVNKFIK
jgi:hypothetical protein